MAREKTVAALEPWLKEVRSSLVASFAARVLKDREAVAAADSLPWSYGRMQDQISKLKLVKRFKTYALSDDRPACASKSSLNSKFTYGTTKNSCSYHLVQS